jgi:hypothetical protein
VRILAECKLENRIKHIETLIKNGFDVQPYNEDSFRARSEFLTGGKLMFKGFEADFGVLVKVEGNSPFGKHSYQPTVFTGTQTISNEQRLELFFAGYVLAQIQGCRIPHTLDLTSHVL